MNITKTGQLITDRSNIRYLVNNVTKTGTTTGWTFGSSTFVNGVVTLTLTGDGYGPTILSPTFPVGANDIICVEFTVALPTPSELTGGGKGLYLGTPTGQGVFVHSFNHTTKKWTASTSANNNPYFLNAYNLSATLIMKNYVIGSSVNLNDVPWGETTNTSYPAKAIQLPSNVTTSQLRSGYNANRNMVITFQNPRFYNNSQDGFYENDEIVKASFGQNWVNGYSMIEY